MNAHEVWVTGLGVVSPFGRSIPAALERLLAGECAPASDPASRGRLVARCAEPGFDRATRRLDRSARLFHEAASDAWRDAGLAAPGALDNDALGACAFEDDARRERRILIEGSSLGPMGELAATLPARSAASATDLVRFMPGAGGAFFAETHGIAGSVLHLSAGSVSAAAAIGEAFLRVARGDADLAVAGGSECPLALPAIETFARAGVLAAPGEPCRPFDAARTGTVLAEGAGALVLESAEHARARGAQPWCVLVGYGFATGGAGMTAPDPEGREVARAIRAAAGPDTLADVGWIKAHGTGTRANDGAECRGLASALGEHRFEGLPLTSFKGALGHALGASGAIEAAFALAAHSRGWAPGVSTLCERDPALPPSRPIARAERTSGGHVLLLSESFGGRAVALLARRSGLDRPPQDVFESSPCHPDDRPRLPHGSPRRQPDRSP